MEKLDENITPDGAALIVQLQRRFAGYWRRLTAPTVDEDFDPAASDSFVAEYLANLKERAYLERTIANQYRGRYLLELLQNAVDAMHKHATSMLPPDLSKGDESEYNDEVFVAGLDGYRCHVELTPLALYVANDGQSFDENDVRGVCAMGQSTKPAGEYIGYKGLGFRAVLEISDSPEIYSGAYQFGFSAAQTLTLLGETSVKPDVQAIPILTVPFQRTAADPQLPASERTVLARLQKAGYATIVRLPLKSVPVGLYSEVREACQQLLSDHTLLFLPYITDLSVAISDDGSGVTTTINKSSREVIIKPTELALQVRVSRLIFRQTETLSGARQAQADVLGVGQTVITPQDWLLVEARQPLPVTDPQLITALEDPTWQGVKQVGIAAAYPLARLPWGGGDVFLKRRAAALPFFAHFPTQEGNGLGLAVSSDFYLSASRKQIEWEVAYNQWLAMRVADFICGPALHAVHYLYPDDAALVEILADYAYYNDRFGRAFREIMDNNLTHTAFVPVGNGNYMPPGRVVWTPLEQAGVLIFRRVFRYPGEELYYPVLQLEQVHSDSSDTGYRKKDYDYDSQRDYDYGGSYDYDDRDSDRYDTERHAEPEPAPEFDYKRIRQFLGSLGVKKLSSALLPEIFRFTLQGWDSGLILTGEICAALALWYAELGKGQEGAVMQRRLVEQARSCKVLPTLAAGWQQPDNQDFSFADASFAPNLADEFDADKIFNPVRISLLATTRPGQAILEIDPAAYDLTEYTELVRHWFQALGVR